MEAELFVPIAFFAFIGAIILVPIWLKEKTKQSAHTLISQALEKGQQLDPALLQQLTETQKAQQPDRPRRTLGSGVVLFALAIGFVVASLMSNGFDPSGFAGDGMMTAAAILGCLGIAFIVLALVDYSAKKKG
jgi:uncharacterized membrane protein YcjF (UPF0283 family)